MNKLLANKKYFIIVIGLILILFIFFYCLNLKDMQVENINIIFSEESWKKEPRKRIYMYEDLIENHDLYGMHKDEVLLMLGSEACTKSKDGSITYYMGEKDGGWFSYNLIIGFDEKDRVNRFELYQD